MTEPTLSILICTLEGRESQFNDLIKSLKDNTSWHETFFESKSYVFRRNDGLVEILSFFDDGKLSTGTKRNVLLQAALGMYISYIDDDDEIASYYIEEILKGAESDCDCMGMLGYMTTNGANKIGWELSKDFQNDTVTRNGKPFYIRKTNHIAPVKRELALKTMFPDISNGEDKDYSDRLNPLLKTEYKIPMPDMYHYRYVTRQKEYLR